MKEKRAEIMQLMKRYSKKDMLFIDVSSYGVGFCTLGSVVLNEWMINYALEFNENQFLKIIIGFIALAIIKKLLIVFRVYAIRKVVRIATLKGKEEELYAITNMRLQEVETKSVQTKFEEFEKMFQNMHEVISAYSARISNSIYIFGVIIFVMMSNVIGGMWFVFLLTMGVILQKKNAKFISTFWEQYMYNSAKCNYLSDIMICQEYAEERCLFETTNLLKGEFEREFKEAQALNRVNGRRRLKFDLGLEICNKVLLVSMMLLWIIMLHNETLSIGEFVILVENIFVVLDTISEELSKENKFDEYRTMQKSFIAFVERENRKANECEKTSVECKKDYGEIKIEFRNVSFGYKQDAVSLKNFSHTFYSGKSYLIVGENGAGKSTFIRMLLGLCQPLKGQVLLNGKSMETYTTKEIADIFAVVFQDGAKYPISLWENTSFSEDREKLSKIKTQYGDLEIVKYIESIENGWDLQMGHTEEKHTDLSGGQWQQLLFLRAILKEAKILVLDEPTSNLDIIVEKDIHHIMSKHKTKQLQIVVSHRLNIGEIVDEIIVMKNGEIIEVGTQLELLEKKGIYYELYHTQKEIYS